MMYGHLILDLCNQEETIAQFSVVFLLSALCPEISCTKVLYLTEKKPLYLFIVSQC